MPFSEPARCFQFLRVSCSLSPSTCAFNLARCTETEYSGGMPSVECPQCRAPAAMTMGQAYCPQCGWNREEAEKRTRFLLRLLPLLVIGFDGPLMIWVLTGHIQPAGLVFFAALAIVPVVLVVLTLRGTLRKVSAAPRPAAAVAASAGTGSIAAPNEAAAEHYRLLLELPRPRPVRMTRRGKMSVSVIVGAVLVFAFVLVAMALLQPPAARRNGAPASRALVIALPLGLLTAMALVMQRALGRERELLGEGEVVMGRVTKQWTARNGRGIRYEFTTASGETISRMTTDFAQQLMEGMALPVFYDALDPKKQVALCAAFYEVVLPGQR